MKFAHSIKQKTRVALLLFSIMVCIILVRILEDKNVKELGKSFTSLYNDRLIPATDLFFIAEKLYAKRYALEMHVNVSTADKNKLKYTLANYDKSIDSLLGKYEKTYLVSNEKDYLADLKNKLASTRKVEAGIIASTAFTEQSRSSSNSAIENSFKGLFDKLAELTQIQTKVGEELIKESQSNVSGSKIYSSVQFVLAIVIGVLIVSILYTSNVINIKNEKFNLN